MTCMSSLYFAILLLIPSYWIYNNIIHYVIHGTVYMHCCTKCVYYYIILIVHYNDNNEKSEINNDIVRYKGILVR